VKKSRKYLERSNWLRKGKVSGSRLRLPLFFKQEVRNRDRTSSGGVNKPTAQVRLIKRLDTEGLETEKDVMIGLN